MSATFTVIDPDDDTEASLLIDITHEGLLIEIHDEDGVTLAIWSATADEIARSFLAGAGATLLLRDGADLLADSLAGGTCPCCGA